MSFTSIIEKFDVKKEDGSGKYQAICPAHDDKKASLTITEEEDKLLLHCHAGCSVNSIVDAIDVSMTDLFKKSSSGNNGSGKKISSIKYLEQNSESLYIYKDGNGNPYMLVRRLYDKKGFPQYSPADFTGEKWQAGLNGRSPILYRLPELLKAIEQGLTIFIVEGEKDVDNLFKIGLIGTTNPMGGTSKNKNKNWRLEFTEILKDAKEIIILPDNDETGQKHGKKVAKSLRKAGHKRIKIVNLPNLPDKGDVSDFLQAGGTRTELLNIIENTDYYIPKAKEEQKEKQKEETLKASDTGIRPDSFYTDTWNTEQFIEQHKENIRYCPEKKKWFLWNGKAWELDRKEEIQKLVKETVRSLYRRVADIKDKDKRFLLLDWIKATESKMKRKALVELAQCEVPILPEELDQDIWLLNVNNGTLELKTGDFREHRREDYITKTLDVDYNLQAECKTWKQFLNKIFDNNENLINFIQKAVGYSLTGSTQEQCIFILHGAGQNGKSTFLSMLAELMGEYSQKLAGETLMKKRFDNGIPEDVARLKGVRLAIAVETGENRSFAEVKVKELTGGDKVTGRFLRENTIEFIPTCKIWLASNHKPTIRGTDFAIWRRIRLIPFDVTIPEEERDEELLEKLKAEKEGILLWAIEGLKKWRMEKLKAPEEVKKATDDYKKEMDVIGEFIDECCVLGNKEKVSAKVLYEAYKSWAVTDFIKQKSFGMKLNERGFKREKQDFEGRRNVYVYSGISLVNSSDVDDVDDVIEFSNRNNSYKNDSSSYIQKSSTSSTSSTNKISEDKKLTLNTVIATVDCSSYVDTSEKTISSFNEQVCCKDCDSFLDISIETGKVMCLKTDYSFEVEELHHCPFYLPVTRGGNS